MGFAKTFIIIAALVYFELFQKGVKEGSLYDL
jgi:hypothetical protein